VDLRRRRQRRFSPRRHPLKADPSRQWRLLDLQALDTRLDQIAHAKARLPHTAAMTQARAELANVETDLVNARTAHGDVQRELLKSDQDVQLVRDRAARDQARLDSGQGSAKDLQALQHELQSLARRQSELDLRRHLLRGPHGPEVAGLVTAHDGVGLGAQHLACDRITAFGPLPSLEVRHPVRRRTPSGGTGTDRAGRTARSTARKQAGEEEAGEGADRPDAGNPTGLPALRRPATRTHAVIVTWPLPPSGLQQR
jgi:hypothetical protein